MYDPVSTLAAWHTGSGIRERRTHRSARHPVDCVAEAEVEDAMKDLHERLEFLA
jgi:hypothetical protein